MCPRAWGGKKTDRKTIKIVTMVMGGGGLGYLRTG